MNGMKAMFVIYHDYLANSGAELSARALCSRIAAGNSVRVLSFAGAGARARDAGVDIRFAGRPPVRSAAGRLRFHIDYIGGSGIKSRIAREARDFVPDVIMTEGIVTPFALAVAEELRCRSVAFVRSAAVLCPDYGHHADPLRCRGNCFRCTPRWAHRAAYPVVAWTRARHMRWLRRAGALISNSGYTRRLVRKMCGCDSFVVPPVMELKLPGPGERERPYILFVKPAPAKGADLVARLARRLPHRQFLIAGDYPSAALEELKSLPNVTWVRSPGSMNALYAVARILLMPSVCPETFGRTAVEAMAAGTVCIASAAGGLPETVGEAGILLDPTDTDAWEEYVELLFRNAPLALRYAEKGRERARRFLPDAVMARFSSVLARAAGVNL